MKKDEEIKAMTRSRETHHGVVSSPESERMITVSGGK